MKKNETVETEVPGTLEKSGKDFAIIEQFFLQLIALAAS
jgi:hypothetical protein